MATNQTGLRTLDRVAADPRVVECYRDSDGIWVSLAPGWREPLEGTHQIHEDTAAAVLSKYCGIVPCDEDDECRQANLRRTK